MDLQTALTRIEASARKTLNAKRGTPERMRALDNHQTILRIMEGMKTAPEGWKDRAVRLAESAGYKIN